jgi:hypothetical protein
MLTGLGDPGRVERAGFLLARLQPSGPGTVLVVCR